MKTRIDIDQSSIIANRDMLKVPGDPKQRLYQMPVVIRDHPEQRAYGAILEGTVEVFYKRDCDPQIYIIADGKITPTNETSDDPSEDKTGKLTYVYVHQNARVPPPAERVGNKRKSKKDEARLRERLAWSCPALIKRKADTPDWGHRIRIEGKSEIVYSLCKTLRGGRGETGVRLWLQTESNRVECTTDGNCCCSGKDSAHWPWFCPYLLKLSPALRRRTFIDTLPPDKRKT
jgi:hypothetical protein